jgi:hypothetical protein
LEKKLKLFLECVETFQDENDFYSYRNGVVSAILKEIENSQSYQEFVSQALLESHKTDGLPKNLFIENNADKTCISVDLKHGNFLALKTYDKSIVKNADTWEKFVRNFTSFEYFQESRHIRQATLGKLNNKRIMNYERVILENEILPMVLESTGFEMKDILYHNFDEIVFDATGWHGKLEVPNKYADDVHVEEFKLEKLQSIYIKRGEKTKLKCVSTNLFPQAYKHVFGKKLKDKDMYFVFDGCLSKYVEETKF